MATIFKFLLYTSNPSYVDGRIIQLFVVQLCSFVPSFLKVLIEEEDPNKKEEEEKRRRSREKLTPHVIDRHARQHPMVSLVRLG
jgi:hypothetical protein